MERLLGQKSGPALAGLPDRRRRPCKCLKFPSVFRPPDSVPFVALHIFFVSRHA